MTTTHYIIFAIMLLLTAGMWCSIGFCFGVGRGRDEQRVEDIMEQWRNQDARRDPATGQFRRAAR